MAVGQSAAIESMGTKNLSVNNINCERHFAKRNDRCSDVIESNEAAIELLVSHEQFSEAIEPAVAYLDNPTPRLSRRVSFLGIQLLAPTHDMRDIAVRLDDFQCAAPRVSGVGAQMLAATDARRLAFDHDARQYRIELSYVMPVRSCHDERQRDSTSVHQQATLAPLFFPGPAGWDRQTLAPVAP